MLGTLSKPKRKVDQKLLAEIRTRPCSVGIGCRGKIEASHIRTRGSGGPDEAWNVVPKCQKHHREWGRSWTDFILKHPHFGSLLLDLGWEIEEDRPRLWHPKLARDSESL